jgi:hypothetical protein
MRLMSAPLVPCRTALIGEAACQIRGGILWKAVPSRRDGEISVARTLAYYSSKRSAGPRAPQLEQGYRSSASMSAVATSLGVI